jgi:predicted kinase
MLSKQQITDSMWNIGKGIADKYPVKRSLVIVEQPGERDDQVKLGYSFNYKKQHVSMVMTYDILSDSLLHARNKVWELQINEEPINETFQTIGHVFDYLAQ